MSEVDVLVADPSGSEALRQAATEAAWAWPADPGEPQAPVSPRQRLVQQVGLAVAKFRAGLAILNLANLRKAADKLRRREAHIIFSAGRNLLAQRLALSSAGPDGEPERAETYDPGPDQTDAPLVSIIIPCFNYGAFVGEAVASALAQTFADLEVIVVDGGSDDGTTRAIVAGLEGPRTRVFLREGGPHQVGSNRNYGIARARGRYICCLDADDRLAPTYIEKALFLIEHRGYDVVSSAMRMFGAEDKVVELLPIPTLENLLASNPVLTCALYRRVLWERVGGYVDSGLGRDHVAEDWDLWLRMAALGARFRNLKETLFHYRVREGGVSLSSGKDVRPLSEQRDVIVTRNQKLLSPAALSLSRQQARRSLRPATPRTPMLIAAQRATTASAPRHRRTLVLAVPFLIVGGAERLLSEVVGGLVRDGWRVVVFSTEFEDGTGGDAIRWFEEHTSETYALPRFLPPADWRDFTYYVLDSRRPDALVIAGSRFFYDLLPELATRYPHMARLDLLFNTEGHAAKHMEHRALLTGALCENSEVEAWLTGVAGWAPARIRRIPSGIDTAAFRPGPRPEALAARLGIPRGAVVVGWSGRLSEEKSPETFVELAGRCRDIPGVHFVMTGGGRLIKQITRQIAELPQGTRMHFLGLVDDISELYRLYDIYTLTSNLDGRPVAVMEAQSSGCAVLASRIGGVPDLIRDGVTGVLANPADAADFEAQLRRLLAEPGRIAAMRRAAAEEAMQRFSVERMIASYCAALEEAVSRMG